MRRALHRTRGVTLQAIGLGILARLLGVRLAGRGADIAAAEGFDLFIELILWLGGLAAGVGGGHFG